LNTVRKKEYFSSNSFFYIKKDHLIEGGWIMEKVTLAGEARRLREKLPA